MNTMASGHSKRWRWVRPALLVGLASLIGLLGATDKPAASSTSAPSAASAASAAPAASASAASAAASEPVAQTRPVTPQPASTAIKLSMLSLDPRSVRLPSARTGRSYLRAVQATDGVPPYEYRLKGGGLPNGMSLDSWGHFMGKPEKDSAASYRFIVQVRDATGTQAEQRYELEVLADAAATTPASPSSAAASKPTAATTAAPVLKQVSLQQPPPRPARPEPQAISYKLMEAQLDALSAAEPAASAASAASGNAGSEAGSTTSSKSATPQLSAAQLKQLPALLKPLLGVEWPSRRSFQAALDARLCEYVQELVTHQAREAQQVPPTPAELAAHCPPNWAVAASPAKPGSEGSAQKERWQDLALSLVSPELRDWLLDTARQEHRIDKAPLLRWDGSGCGCVRTDMGDKQIYGFQPIWWGREDEGAAPPADAASAAAAAPPVRQLDFSMLTRVSVLGLALSAELSREPLGDWNAERTAFLREARSHGTQVDLALIVDDWRLFQPLPTSSAETARKAQLQRVLSQAPQQARRLIDTELPGAEAWFRRTLPFFGEPQTLADGVSLYLTNLPEKTPENQALRDEFKRSYPQLLRGLMQELKHGKRPYALNLVLDAQELGGDGLFEIAQLFELIKIEVPSDNSDYFRDDRIVERSGYYQSGTSVTLRMVVVIPEPTTLSKKQLRTRIEDDPALRGINRRVFLRKIVPVLLSQPLSDQQYSDDLAYFEDNFGGIGFWPMLSLPTNASMNDKLRLAFSDARTDGTGYALCAYACEHRWWIRGLFELALLAGLACFAAVTWRCELRQRWSRYIQSGAALVAALALLLLNCDPAFESLRQHGVLMWTLALLLIGSALWNWLKPKVEMP